MSFSTGTQMEAKGEQILHAVRYAVLQRLAPSLQHKMVGKLQPFSLLSQLLSRKIKMQDNDTEYVLKRLDEIKISAKIATIESQNLFSWIAPDANATKPLNELVDECLNLLKMELYNHQLTIVNSIDATALSNIADIRTIFTATMLTLIDTQLSATIATLNSDYLEAHLRIIIHLTPDQDKEPKSIIGHPRFEDWANIQTIINSKTMKLSLLPNEIVITVF